MKYFSAVALFFITMNVYSIDFDLIHGGNELNGMRYDTLLVKENDKSKRIDIDLEGNTHEAVIRERITLSCTWGIAQGIIIDMSSSTVDGVMVVNNIYFFDENLNNIFAKSYIRFNDNYRTINENWKMPMSLKSSVCGLSGGRLKEDTQTNRYYLGNTDVEIISQGPFQLKNVIGVDIKYVRDINELNFISENENGERIIDSYKNRNNSSSNIKTVFFIKKLEKMNIVNLITWSVYEDIHSEFACYKVYAYKYNKDGVISPNLEINNDHNLSGCDSKGNLFKYRDAATIKRYLNDKYSE